MLKPICFNVFMTCFLILFALDLLQFLKIISLLSLYGSVSFLFIVSNNFDYMYVPVNWQVSVLSIFSVAIHFYIKCAFCTFL